MTAETIKIWTPDEIAEATRTGVEDVIAELDAGRIPSFRIGKERRVTDAAFQAFIAGLSATNGGEAGAPPSPPAVAGGNSQWKPRGRFNYKWPDGKTTESYETAFETDLSLPSGRHHFVIGYTTRKAAGMDDRRRVIVFLGQVPQIVPIVEFCGTNDFLKTRLVASVIKDRTNHHVRAQSQLPTEYQGFRTVMYRDVIIGPYAANSLAVLADDDERDVMLRHAIIRAKYKGLVHD